MGQVSYLEDILERLNENFRRTEARKAPEYAEAVNAIRDEIMQLHELATSPDLDLACEIATKDKRINTLQDFLKVREGELKAKASEIEKLERKSDSHYKDLQDANCQIARLQKDNRRLREGFDFASNVDAYSSSSRIREYRPNG